MQLWNGQRPAKGDGDKKVQSTRFPFLAAALTGMLGVSWHWEVGIYTDPTSLPFWGLPSVISRHYKTPEQGSPLALLRTCHSFTQAHCKISETLRDRQRKRFELILLIFNGC